MKAEALRELISRKHPPTDAIQLSNPGLLKHSAHSREKRARAARRGEHRGWAGPGRCNYLRQERAGLWFLPEHTPSCASSRAAELPVRPCRRAGAGDLPVLQHKSISTSFLLSSRTAPKGNRNSGATVSARGSRTRVGYLCSLGQKMALCAVLRVVLGSGRGSGSSPRRAARSRDGACAPPRPRPDGDPSSRGKGRARRQRQRGGWAVSRCHARLWLVGSEAAPGRTLLPASWRGAEARSAGGDGQLMAGLLRAWVISTVPVLSRSSSLRGHSYFPCHEKCKYY